MQYISPMKRFHLFPLLLLFLLPASLFAQYDPGINWQYIDTEYNRIIFPDFMIDEGLRAAALTEQVRPLITENLEATFFHAYPIILTGNDMTGNGYVTVFPRRSVWYTFNRGFGSGTGEWYDHLAVHEGRHTVQFDKLNSSAGHVLYLMGGESWYALTIAVTPPWMLEGDAIITETEYTPSGRGRLGSYFELMRGLSLEEAPPSYYKMLLHSYKDMTPTAHALGYPFMNWLEEEYGPLSADTLFGSLAELPLPLAGSSRAVRKLTGLSPRKAYEEMMDGLKEETRDIIASKGPLKQGERLSPVPGTYTSYSQLGAGSRGEWYALRGDMVRSSAFYRYDGEREKKLSPSLPATRIDGSEDAFVWDSRRTSLTWTTREASDLFLKKEGRQAVRLTRGGRYYHPALNDSGDRVAALEWTVTRKPVLTILDTEGAVRQRIPFPEEITYASWPVWVGNDLILLVQNRYGEAIWKFAGDTFTPLIPFTTEDLGHPEPWEGGVFFSLDRYEGQEICYLKDGIIRKITNTPLGADHPAVDLTNKRLLYIESEGALGDSVRALPLGNTKGGQIISLDPLPPFPSPGLAGFAGDTGGEYTVEKYNPLELFSPVGWGMTIVAVPEDDLEIPFALTSINPMQTLGWEAGLYYNVNENTLAYRGTAELALFLPRITSGISLDERKRDGRTIKDLTLSAGLSFPLGFTRGRDRFSLSFGGDAFYLNSRTDSTEDSLTGFSEELTLLHSRAGSYRSLQPRFEEGAAISHIHTTEESVRRRLTASAHLLLPGLFPTHGTGFYAFYEQNPSLLTSGVPAVRGKGYTPEKEQILVKAEYLLPLLYPDLALGGLAYLPRISTELFLDRQWSGEAFGETSTAGGCELLADASILSLPLQIRGGFRFSWLVEEASPSVQFVIKGYMINN